MDLHPDIAAVLAGERQWAVVCGDALGVTATLADSSVDLIIADPPYMGVKDRKSCAWDHQWKTRADYLAWIGQLCAAWARVLKPNGSLYVFASPQMAAHVEVTLGQTFNVLNRITWRKESGWARKRHKEEMRAFWPASEAILFAEHHGADNVAKREAGYAAKCDELRGFVFEPLRAYLDGERRRAGVNKGACNEACGFSNNPGGMAVRHYFSQSQWCLPTQPHYEAMQRLFNANCNGGGPQYLRREYEDLRREYEDLRREYEDLRRPFSVSADVPYTDVWDFATVQHYPGKHPCEKPQALLEHIVTASSRPGAVVLDPFAGSGVLGEVCGVLGREYIGIEIDPAYCAIACRRLEAAERREDRMLFSASAPKLRKKASRKVELF